VVILEIVTSSSELVVLYSDSVTTGIGGDGGEISRFLSMTAGLKYLEEQEDKFLSV
jgi:hypothetical protein